MNSTTEMKITLVKNDEEERSKGRIFMKRVEERWDLEFLEQASVSIDNLRSNASHFEKGPNKELILVGNRIGIDWQQGKMHEDPSNH